MNPIVDTLRAQAATLLTLADYIEQQDREREGRSTATDRALRPQEAADQLGVSRATVRNLVRSGRLKAENHGGDLWRVRESELKAYRRRITRGSEKR